MGPAHGQQAVFVDGQPYRGDPARIVLGSHEDIQLDVGTPLLSPQRVLWSNSRL